MASIADFFAGRNIFITGVTGFMGKVLLEKLFRSCPAIGKVYVLVRPKKGNNPQQRIVDMLQSKLFEKVRGLYPDFEEKIVAIAGDILEPGLGISGEDEAKLTSEISIVFHSAATVKFDEALKLSVQMNVLGTRAMIELCQKMTKLEALIHVSTAYANCDRQQVSEEVYPPPLHPKKLLDAMEWMDDDVIEILTPKLINPRPNTYTHTKAMAEFLLVEESRGLPVAIVRPSIVGASWQEPVPGWVDNFNGPTGLLAAIGKGVLRIMKGDFNATADVIPVDIATNLMIASAWYTALERPQDIKVYNCTTGSLNRLTWGQIERASYTYFMKHPLDDIIRLPHPRFTTNSFWYFTNVYMDHYLPAWIMDMLTRLTGGKPRYMKFQQKLWKSVNCLEFFTSNQWSFSNENMLMLFDKLSSEDKSEFNFNVKDVDWTSYLENYCIGTKMYALKEQMSGMPKAKQGLLYLQRWAAFRNFALVLVAWRLLMARVAVARKLFFLLIDWAVRVFNQIPMIARST